MSTIQTDNPHEESGWVYKVVYDDLGNCGCGYHDERLNLVKWVLRDASKDWYDRTPYDSALAEWLLSTVDHAGLISHGTTIRSFWITEKGKRFLAGLEDESIWRSLTNDECLTGYCMCGNCPGDSLSQE